MNTFTVPQIDELREIRRLVGAVEMAVVGSVSLDPNERAALNAIATFVSPRMSALVDAIHDDAAAPDAEPKSPAARMKRKGK